MYHHNQVYDAVRQDGAGMPHKLDSWEHAEPDQTHLPPDYTPGGNMATICRATSPRYGYVCTRNPHHTGRHAAGDGLHILAVWA